MAKPYRLTVAADSSVQTGYALFNDSAMLAQSRIGVEVAMTTTEYRKTDLDNFVIVRYRLKNTSGAPLTNLHCGLYLDWDIGLDGLGDVAGFDPDSRMGYQQNPDAGQQKLLTGAAILEGNGDNFYAINNDDPENGVQIDFSPAKKWGKISGGLARTLSDPGDASMMIAAGPIAIAAGDTATVAFSLLAATDFQVLRQSVARAKVAYNGSSPAPAEEPANSFTMLQSFPNPARGVVTIRWGNPPQRRAVLEVHNLMGQTIMQLPVAALFQVFTNKRFIASKRSPCSFRRFTLQKELIGVYKVVPSSTQELKLKDDRSQSQKMIGQKMIGQNGITGCRRTGITGTFDNRQTYLRLNRRQPLLAGITPIRDDMILFAQDGSPLMRHP